MLRKEREYIIQLSTNVYARVICVKIVKNPKNEIEKYCFSFVDTERTLDLLPSHFLNNSYVECLDNSELFIMYTNWQNFYRPSLHQDLVFAEEVGRSIINTVKDRSFVKKGTGFWTDFDHRLFKNILDAHET